MICTVSYNMWGLLRAQHHEPSLSGERLCNYTVLSQLNPITVQVVKAAHTFVEFGCSSRTIVQAQGCLDSSMLSLYAAQQAG
jgi:hypothetical protein